MVGFIFFIQQVLIEYLLGTVLDADEQSDPWNSCCWGAYVPVEEARWGASKFDTCQVVNKYCGEPNQSVVDARVCDGVLVGVGCYNENARGCVVWATDADFS